MAVVFGNSCSREECWSLNAAIAGAALAGARPHAASSEAGTVATGTAAVWIRLRGTASPRSTIPPANMGYRADKEISDGRHHSVAD